ncbi:hypothetical protein H9P43_009725 [Blastocladiella emersonii ATCC 22665]|nr:hypothetical protein H9P43_009725 [Blastocladiella emersonii ATCC 22665]
MKKKQKKSNTTRISSTAAGRPANAAPSAPPAPPALPTLTCTSVAAEDRARHFYPLGRSYPRDLAMNHFPVGREDINVLAFQCGDLRDVARTISDAKPPGLSHPLQTSVAHGPTLVLLIEFILHPYIARRPPSPCWIIDKENVRLLREIGGKALRGNAKVTQLVVPRAYLPCLVDCLLFAFSSIPRKVYNNEANFEPAFFEVVKSRLFRAHLLPLFAPPGSERDGSVERDNEDANDCKELNTLVFQCGDLRDVARTIADSKRKYADANLNFLVSDTNPEVLVRSLLVLRAVQTHRDSDISTLALHVAQLLYSSPSVNPTLLLARDDGSLEYGGPNTLAPLHQLVLDFDDILGGIHRDVVQLVSILVEQFGPKAELRRQGNRFAWSTARVEGRDQPHREEFTFYRHEFPTVPISLAKSPFLLDSLVQCIETLACSHEGGAIVVSGPDLQIMQFSYRVGVVSVAAAPGSIFNVTAVRILSPVNEAVALGEMYPNIADYSDRFPLGKVDSRDQMTALASLQHAISTGEIDAAALEHALKSARVDDSSGPALAAAKKPSAADQAFFLGILVWELFVEFVRGARVIELTVSDDSSLVAVILMHGVTVVPPASHAHAPTPVLNLEFILDPSIATPTPSPEWIIDDGNKRLLPLIAGNAHRGKAKVRRLKVPRAYLPCLVDCLMLAFSSIPFKMSFNEANFEPAFFKQVKSRLFRAYLLPLYHPPGAECPRASSQKGEADDGNAAESETIDAGGADDEQPGAGDDRIVEV